MAAVHTGALASRAIKKKKRKTTTTTTSMFCGRTPPTNWSETSIKSSPCICGFGYPRFTMGLKNVFISFQMLAKREWAITW
jgi:hypothetical protein